MSASYGVVAVYGDSAAVDCLNEMSRAANVRLLTWDSLLGESLVTLIVQGSVADVTTAVRAAKKTCALHRHKLSMGGIIPHPDEETERAVLQSAQRMVESKHS